MGLRAGRRARLLSASLGEGRQPQMDPPPIMGRGAVRATMCSDILHLALLSWVCKQWPEIPLVHPARTPARSWLVRPRAGGGSGGGSARGGAPCMCAGRPVMASFCNIAASRLSGVCCRGDQVVHMLGCRCGGPPESATPLWLLAEGARHNGEGAWQPEEAQGGRAACSGSGGRHGRAAARRRQEAAAGQEEQGGGRRGQPAAGRAGAQVRGLAVGSRICCLAGRRRSAQLRPAASDLLPSPLAPALCRKRQRKLRDLALRLRAEGQEYKRGKHKKHKPRRRVHVGAARLLLHRLLLPPPPPPAGCLLRGLRWGAQACTAAADAPAIVPHPPAPPASSSSCPFFGTRRPLKSRRCWRRQRGCRSCCAGWASSATPTPPLS